MSYILSWNNIKTDFQAQFGEETTKFLFYDSLILDVKENDIYILIDELCFDIVSRENTEIHDYLNACINRNLNRTMKMHFTTDKKTSDNVPKLKVSERIIENKNSHEETNLDASKHFYNYFYSYDNKPIIDACKSIVQEIKATGKTNFNPLFIHGESGIGKTHIASALGNKLYEEKLNLKILYQPATVFLNNFTSAFQNGLNTDMLEEFKKSYEGIDVFILDDIQMLQTRESTLNQFFNIYESLVANNKLIIITCDVDPNRLNIKDRLLTRFLSGLVIEMNTPDTDTKTEIFKHYAEELNQLEFEDQAIQAFIQNSDSVRALSGYINSIRLNYLSNAQKYTDRLNQINLDHQSNGTPTVDKAPFTLQDALEILKINSGEKTILTKRELIETICKYFDITTEVLLSGSRRKKIVQARNLCIIYLYDYIGMTQEEIGYELGFKSHSNVSKMLKKREQVKQDLEKECFDLEQIMNKVKLKM